MRINKNGGLFNSYVDLTQIKDAMQLDSNNVICSYLCPNKKYMVTIEVEGEVDVDYNGENYRQASDMPDELLKLIGDPHTWYSGDADEGLYVNANNWFEIFIYYTDENDKEDEWTGVSDVIECAGETDEQLMNDCIDYLDTYIKSRGGF